MEFLTRYFCWYRKDVPELLNAMDIFVHASVEPEPFGRVILEAMLMGKPIVASDGGGVPELLENDHLGLLVPMGDAKSMAKAIGKYIDDMESAKRFGNRALQTAKDKFSIQKMVQGVEQVYGEVFSK